MVVMFVWFYCGMDCVIGKVKLCWWLVYWIIILIYMLVMIYGVVIVLVIYI